MAYLNTTAIIVGDERFVLSEFTPLDRLHDLEYAHRQPPPENPGDHADRAEKVHYGLAIERLTLSQTCHSIALSLAHNNPSLAGQSVEDIQGIVRTQWSQRAVNEAYQKILALNKGEEPDPVAAAPDEDRDQEPESLGKLLHRLGNLLLHWRNNCVSRAQ